MASRPMNARTCASGCSRTAWPRLPLKESSAMRRVVVTGLGITSSIGNNAEEVADSLKAGRSGIVFAEDYARLNFRSQVHGTVKIDLEPAVDRRQKRFMGDGAPYAYLDRKGVG